MRTRPRLNEQVCGSDHDASDERKHAGKQHDVDDEFRHCTLPVTQRLTARNVVGTA